MNLPLPRLRRDEIQTAREKNLCPVECLDYYRMPNLFAAGKALFGRPYYNDEGRTRLLIDKQITWMCRTWRQKYPGGCTVERSRICRQLIEDAFQVTQNRPRNVPAQPYLIGVLRRLVNADRTHALLKPTVDIPRTSVNTIFHRFED